MIDDHRARTALGLRALTGIIDDKRIDMRRRPEHGFRIAVFRQRQRLARQPFEIAMLAHVNNGVDFRYRAQIGIEGDITMRRDQIGRMIAFLRVDIVAARGLNAGQCFAKPHQRQRKSVAFTVVERIGFRHTPAGGDFRLNRIGKLFEKVVVLIERNDFANLSAIARGIGRPGHQKLHQRVTIRRHVAGLIARIGHGLERLDRSGRRIQPNAIA